MSSPLIITLILLSSLIFSTTSQTAPPPPLINYESSLTTPLIMISPPEPITVPFPLNYFDQSLNKNVFYGNWFAADVEKAPFNFFDRRQGFVSIEIYKSLTAGHHTYFRAVGEESTASYAQVPVTVPEAVDTVPRTHTFSDSWTMMMKIYDGEYVDQKSATILYNFNSTSNMMLNPKNSTMSVVQDFIDLTAKESGMTRFSHEKYHSTFSLYFIDRITQTPWNAGSSPTSNTLLQLNIQSPECGMNLTINVSNDQGFTDDTQVLIYSGIMTLLGLITVLGSMGLKYSLKRNHMAYKVSLVSLWFLSTLDYYLLILNLALIFTYSLWAMFPSLVYTFLTFHVERKTILRLLRERGEREENDSNQDCKSCGFYFIGLSILFILQVCFVFTFKLWILHISALFFVPQIIHNVIRGRKYSFNPYHIIVMGMPRLLLIFYVKYYPANIFRFVPDLSFVIIFSSLVLGQVLILMIQTKYPRFCLRRSRRKMDQLLCDDDICSICMGHLTYVSSTESRSPVKREGLPLIETSCRHVFHRQCLQRWVKNKVDCPVCRRSIKDTMEEIECSDNSATRIST